MSFLIFTNELGNYNFENQLCRYLPKISNSFIQGSIDQKNENNSISKIKLKLQDIQDAHTRIKNDIVYTPVVVSSSIFMHGFTKVRNELAASIFT